MGASQIGKRAWSYAGVPQNSLPPPDVLATEIADDLAAALEEFNKIAARLGRKA